MPTAVAHVTIGGTSGPLGLLEGGHGNTQKFIEVYGTISIDASPATYATGGLALVNALNAALSAWASENIKGVSQMKTGDAGPTPLIVYCESTTGSGFWYVWNNSSGPAGKLQILTTGTATQAPAAELTNTSAIPAGVSGDTIFFEAKFVRR